MKYHFRFSNDVRLFVLLASVGLFLSPNTMAYAQPDEAIPVADTSSPRSTLQSFIDACNELHQLIGEEHYFDRTDPQHTALARRVLDCLDVSEIPAFVRKERAAEVAICLKEILDRHPLPSWEEIPDLSDIEAPGGFEKYSRWRIPGTRVTISRIEEGPQKHEFLFSSGTVDRAIEYFEEIESRAYRSDGPTISAGFYDWFVSAPGHQAMTSVVSHLPDWLRYSRTFGVTNWKWCGLFFAALISLGLMVALYRWHLSVASRTKKTNITKYCLTLILPILAGAIPLIFERVVFYDLSLRGRPLYAASFCAYALTTFAGIVVIFALCNRIAELIIASPKINPRGLNAQLVRIAARLASVVLAVAGFLIGGQYLGIPVATLFASAGIGGVALALGAQDTLKTVFGTVLLMADKPFRVGDRIIVKGYDGVVEDIGLRSTKVRLLTSHLVTIPNDELARSDVENVGRRQSIRRVADIHLPLDTPLAKIERAVAIIRGELSDHEGMHPDFPPRVAFLDFVSHAFVIRMTYWYHPPDYWAYLAFSEALNLAIFRSFEEGGIRFALPRRITTSTLDGEVAPMDLRIINSEDRQQLPAGKNESTEPVAKAESP